MGIIFDFNNYGVLHLLPAFQMISFYKYFAALPLKNTSIIKFHLHLNHSGGAVH